MVRNEGCLFDTLFCCVAGGGACSMMWSARNKAQGWDSRAQSLFRYMLLAAAVFVAPHAIALLLFLVPPISRALESSNLPLLRVLTSGLQVWPTT